MDYGQRFDGDLARRGSRDELIDQLVATYGLDRDLVSELYAAGERAAADDPFGRSSVYWFERLAGVSEARRAPAPGQRSRAQLVYGGAAPRARTGFRAPMSPGKVTRTMSLAAQLAESRPRRAPERLAPSVEARMSQLFGADFSRVKVHAESPEATGSIKALTRGDEIHFREGAYQPGTREGDRLISHELAHVVQQGSDGVRGSRANGKAGTRRELEREADQAAALVATGRAARVTLGAGAAAYAYDEAERHEEDAEPGERSTADETRRDANVERAAESGPGHEEQGEAERRPARARHPEPARGEEPRATSNEARSRPERPRDEEPGATTDAARGRARAGSGGRDGHGAAVPATNGAAAAFAMSAGSARDVITSLRDAPASRAVDALGQALSLSPGVLAKQRDAAQEALPKLETPTGMAAKGSPRRAPEPATASRPAVSARENRPAPAAENPHPAGQEGIVREAPPAPPTPTRLAGKDGPSAEEGQKNDPALAHSAQQALAHVGAPVDDVPTRAEERPRVQLTGDADLAQLETGLRDSQQETAESRDRALDEMRRDFGEEDIVPEPDDEILAARRRLAAPRPITLAGEGGEGTRLPVEAMASIDTEASPILRQRIGQEQERYAAGEEKYAADSQAAHDQARDDIQLLETGTRADQERAQASASTRVSEARQEGQIEIEAVEAEFQAGAGNAQRERGQRIQTEEQSGNREAARHIAEAEEKAELEKGKAREDVAREKESASKESGGFWGWVKSKATALVDAVKQRVNVIYDKLRETVKALFELAKQAALLAIEVARKVVVGIIKAYGEILKGLVRVALAAFPTIRDRVLRRIDEAVNAAKDLVNRVAEALVTAVSGILDFLASTIDQILGLVQSLYNAVLTVIGMIVSGQLQELLARLENLVAAAQTAPGQFETAAYEELLGGNLDEPLSPAELIAAGRVPPAGAAGPHTAGAEESPLGEAGEELPGEAGEKLPGPPWTEENVGVDAVAADAELSPELTRQLLARTGGGDGEVTFGESNEPDRSLESLLGGQPAMEGRGAGEAEGERARAPSAPADGLTPGERAEVKWTLLKQGLARWWSENWPYIIGGGVLAVAGFIVATFLTGGAILAALPPLMTALGYIFAGVMAVQLAGHLRDFLQKGWNGEAEAGGKSLAKALAAGAIELLTWLTFKVGSAAMSAGKAMGRSAVEGAQSLSRAGTRVARGTARAARHGADYVLRGGKVLLRGAGDAVGRGAKSLRELGERLLARTKFRGFRIRIASRRWELEGKINPWALLANGRIVEVQDLPPGAKVGDLLDDAADGMTGRIVAIGKDLPDAATVARVQRDVVEGLGRKYQQILDDNPSMRSWLEKLKNQSPSPAHFDELATFERRVEYGAKLRRGEYPNTVSFGANTFEKMNTHQKHLRSAGDELGMPINKGQLTQEVQDQMKRVMEHVLKNGEQRVGRYKHYDDALWSRVGDNFLLRQSDGTFITFVKGDSGAALQFTQAMR